MMLQLIKSWPSIYEHRMIELSHFNLFLNEDSIRSTISHLLKIRECRDIFMVVVMQPSSDIGRYRDKIAVNGACPVLFIHHDYGWKGESSWRTVMFDAETSEAIACVRHEPDGWIASSGS